MTLATALFSLDGRSTDEEEEEEEEEEDHILLISSAKAAATSPLLGLRGLRVLRALCDEKYSASGGVLLKHCNAEFIKHVLPRFCKPTRPRGDETIGVDTANDDEEEKDEEEEVRRGEGERGGRGAIGARECVTVSREFSLTLFVFRDCEALSELELTR